ncbi:MAG: FAD-dependent oxidoreductase [Gammaproteobacteria bacterium]|nr:MAG: FAD-dependent oxidoreductase [Gammaproteobacteria bacterium]
MARLAHRLTRDIDRQPLHPREVSPLELNRRHFLYGSVAAMAAASSLGTASLKSASASAPRVAPGARVLVIGAGFAGIGAARALALDGYTPLIVDARDRIGGRAWSHTDLGTSVDLGAAWLHGGDDNPLKPHAQQLQIPWHPADYGNGRRIDLRGDVIGVAELADSMGAPALQARLADGLFWAWLRWRLGRLVNASGSGRSLAEHWEVAFAGAPDADACALRGAMESYFAAPLDEIALESLFVGEGDELLPSTERLMTGGMQRLAEGLATNLDVRLDTIVERLEWSPGRVTAITTDGEIEAEAAVITASVGLLQQSRPQLSPALPDTHRSALNRLAMGLLNKIVLRYPHRTWDDGEEYLALCGSRLASVVINYGSHGGAPILVGMLGGQRARDVEGMSNDKAVGLLHAELRRILGANLPEPDAAIVTRWGQDPWSLGSYSFLPVGARGNEAQTLAEPVADTLFLAGEAIDTGGYGAAHNAWRSGLRAARQISGGGPLLPS